MSASTVYFDPDGYLTRGGRRLIYQHPERADRLLKVIRPDRRGNDWPRRLLRRAGHYHVFREELSDYLVLRSRDPNREPLVAPVHGLVETNLGLGLEVEKITGPEGDLAPTFDDLIRDRRITAEKREGIDRLARRLGTLHMVVSDFKAHNLVLLPNGKDFWVVDGPGEKTLLGLRAQSAAFWRLAVERARRKLQARIDARRHRPLRDRHGVELKVPGQRGTHEMIISHRHRFILLKTRKTAGSSVELALSPLLGAGDLATPLRPEEEVRRDAPEGLRHEEPLLLTRFGYPWRVKTHASLWLAHDFIGRSAAEYRFVSLCRNPWDKAVSHFFWSCRDQGVKALDFDTQWQRFIEFTQRKGPRKWYDRLTGRMPPKALDGNYRLYLLDGKPRLDFVIRYEHLEADLAELGRWLGTDGVPTLKGVTATVGLRPPVKRHWTQYYDTATRDLVAEHSRGEVALFGYDFFGEAAPHGPLFNLAKPSQPY